mgnify:CR=1 FL=1
MISSLVVSPAWKCRVPPGSPPPPGQGVPDRVPYQAPPRQRSLMVYLYIGLGILVTILGVMGITQLVNNQEARTAIVTIKEQGSTFPGSAVIVRDEAVFSQEGVSDIVYIAEENAVVSRGDPVCTVYATGFSNREFTQLGAYRKQIKDYLTLLRAQSDTPDTKLQLLESTIFSRAVETRALIQGIGAAHILRDAVAGARAHERGGRQGDPRRDLGLRGGHPGRRPGPRHGAWRDRGGVP